MHILYIHQHFTLPTGSSGTRSYEFAKHFLQAGHKVTVLCGSFALGNTGLSGPFVRGIRKGKVEGINIIEVDINYSNYDNFFVRSLKFLKFTLRCLKKVLMEKYDLVYATTTPLTVGICSSIAKLIKRKPVIFEVRDLWPELPKAMGVIKQPIVLQLLSILEWVSYSTANACIALSPGIKRGIVARGVNADKVSIIPNGCDLQFFEAVRHDQTLPGFTPQDFIAVFTGAHGIANGLEHALDAADILQRQQYNHIKFLFIGDGKIKPDLMLRSRSSGLKNCVFWDPLPKTELKQVLQKVDVGLMLLKNIPAFYQGTSPNKFFDYLAAGLPILNNYPGWIADLIQQNNCGVVVDPENPEAFAAALLELSNNKQKLAEYRNNARTLGERQFDRNELAKLSLAVCEAVKS